MLLNSRKSKIVQATAFLALQNYLKEEAYNRKKISINPYNIQANHANVPQQPNDYDCGVYVIQYIETFFQDTKKYLHYILVVFIIMKGQKDQEEDWFGKSVIWNKRRVIKHLIEKIAEDSRYQ